MPKAFDLYELDQTPPDPAAPLSAFQQQFVLSAFPTGAQIRSVASACDWAFYPQRVNVVANGEWQTVDLF